MAIEAIKVVRQAEKQAAQIREEASQIRREIIKNVDDECRITEENAVSELDAKIRRSDASAKKEVDDRIAILKRDNRLACELLTNNTMSKMDEAVDYIVGRIVKNHGNG